MGMFEFDECGLDFLKTEIGCDTQKQCNDDAECNENECSRLNGEIGQKRHNDFWILEIGLCQYRLFDKKIK